uniref:Transmembrane protein 129 n=2 Tax=Panagrolaimus sp. JU765 TaxID=591449 RepID=A0AC34RQR8_9BILA
MDGIPQEELFLSVAIFVLLSFVVIFPPFEARQSGLVIPHVFHFIVKEERFDFIQHHLRRSCLTILIHALLPMIYTLIMYFYYFENFQHVGSFVFIKLMVRISFTLLFLALGYIYMIWRNNYAAHSIMKNIRKYVNENNTLGSLITQINDECREYDNFKVEYIGYSKVLVTESWVIKVSMYSVAFIKKSDARAKLIRALDSIVPSDTSGKQLLDVLVESVSGVALPLSIRVYDRQMFNDLKDKLGGQVEIVYGIYFKASLNEQFVQVFEHQILDNPRYNYDNRYPLEDCLGCQSISANIKLQKHCLDTPEAPPCRNCSCKPMWCSRCISRIFASKQDPSRTDQWMNGKAECPTCRANFCALDVCLLSGVEIENSG